MDITEKIQAIVDKYIPRKNSTEYTPHDIMRENLINEIYQVILQDRHNIEFTVNRPEDFLKICENITSINNKNKLNNLQEKTTKLTEAIDVLSGIKLNGDTTREIKGIITIIQSYSNGLNILNNYDSDITPKITEHTTLFSKITYEDAMRIIDMMRLKFENDDFFGTEKDDSFKGTLDLVYQTYGGVDLYPTIEIKAANLLFFIVKNHCFIDGNKRIAAMVFIYFLTKNKVLCNDKGKRRIDENTLAAITLMIASSPHADKERMIKVILNMLK